MKHTLALGTEPIGKLLAKYSLPAVVAMLVNAIYNVVDRIFIGKLVGEEALAGLTITFPIMMIIFAFSGLVGMGGASLLAIRLGEKDEEGASHVFGNTFSFAFIVTASVLLVLFVNLTSILSIFGATGVVLHYASSYMTIILSGFIFQMFSFVLSNFVRTEGKPVLSMSAMITSAISNIVLDYIFIAILDLGVKGAAYGTILSQLIGLGIYLNFYLKGRSSIHLKPRDFILDIKVLIKIISIGFTSFISTISTSVAMVFMNKGLSVYGGTAGITSIGAINSLYTFFIMPLMGITSGMQPIIGYNFGAKLYSRVKKTLIMAIIIGSTFSTFVMIGLEVFSKFFISLFMDADSTTIPMAITGLRIFIIMLPFLSINMMGMAYFQSVAKPVHAFFLGLLRQFVFLLPLLYVLPRIWGLLGVWIATPIADGLAILVTALVMIVHFKKGLTIKDGAYISSRVEEEIA